MDQNHIEVGIGLCRFQRVWKESFAEPSMQGVAQKAAIVPMLGANHTQNLKRSRFSNCLHSLQESS
jgi:hypothetical protein